MASHSEHPEDLNYLYVAVCYNSNRQIPTYVHSSNYTRVSACHCVSTCGNAFSNMVETHATRMFYACHVELVANLYRICILSNVQCSYN